MSLDCKKTKTRENLPRGKNSEPGLYSVVVASLSLKTSKDKLDRHLLRITWIKLVLSWVSRLGQVFRGLF